MAVMIAPASQGAKPEAASLTGMKANIRPLPTATSPMERTMLATARGGEETCSSAAVSDNGGTP